MTDEISQKVDEVSWWAAATAFVNAVDFREKCFFAGLGLLWIGVAGWSWRCATALAGAVLVSVAVFGVAPARGKGRAT